MYARLGQGCDERDAQFKVEFELFKNGLGNGHAPQRVTLDIGTQRCSALWDMRSLLEKVPYSLASISVIAYRAENGWPEGSINRTELPLDLALIHAAFCAEDCLKTDQIAECCV